MRRSPQRAGFTIVETMIVLAIMGFLFISATILVTGEQNKTEFSAAIQDVQSVIQQHISEVGSGYYANNGSFTCSVIGGNLSISKNLSGKNSQGVNAGCIFMGKAMQFGVHGTNPEQMITYTVAGLQDNTGDLASAKPTVVAPTTEKPATPDSSTIDSLHSGLSVYKMTNGPLATGVPIGAVAFLDGLGSYDGNNNQLLSGSQQVSVVPINSTALNESPLAGASDIGHNLATSSVLDPSSKGVQICFASGTTNQSGLITIGGNGRQLSVQLDIKDGRKCGL